MKTVLMYWLLLISLFVKPGVCQKPAQIQEDQQTTIVRMQDRLDRLEAEVQRLRDRMVSVNDKLSSTETKADDNTRDIGLLKYVGGGLIFVAGVFVAEIIRRIATRVSFQPERPN